VVVSARVIVPTLTVAVIVSLTVPRLAIAPPAIATAAAVPVNVIRIAALLLMLRRLLSLIWVLLDLLRWLLAWFKR